MGSKNGVGLIIVGMLTFACDGEPSKATAEAAGASKPAVVSAAATPDAQVKSDEATPADEKSAEAQPEASPADQKLTDARIIQFKDPAEAYRIANESYELEPSTKALWVMGPAACRMKDMDKAKWVWKRFVDEDRTKYEELCAAKGLELKPDPI